MGAFLLLAFLLQNQPDLRPLSELQKSALPALCTKTTMFNGKGISCYRAEWQPWLKEEARRIAPAPAQKLMASGGALEDAAEEYLVLPGGQSFVVWATIDKFSDSKIYWLADWKGKSLNGVLQTKQGPAYFGKQSELLKRFNLGPWLLENAAQ